MMSQLYDFTSGLLGKLPFSINTRGEGYKSEIDHLLNDVAEYPLFRSPASVQFLSYSFAELHDIREWRVDRLHPDFFYRAVNEEQSAILLSFYYYFRERVDTLLRSPTDDGKVNNAEVVAQLFLTDSSFRVGFHDNPRATFTYESPINTYTIRLPWSKLVKERGADAAACYRRFRHAYASFKESVAKEMRDQPDLQLKLRSGIHASKSVFTSAEISPVLAHLHEQFYNLVVDEAGLRLVNSELGDLISDYAASYPARFVADERLIKRWVARLPSIALFSQQPNSWTEYMPSTCGHQDVIENGEPRRVWRNLGCLVFGYENELALDTRAYLRMIGVRISSVIAARVAHKLQQEALDHALNSAITQTAARNYAHHIGAHVKMRTTPQEIKKRIGDLYPDLKGLI